ncbi:MAG: hypothetical protein ACOCXZ_03160 [Chloroflexota bacterium]
MSLLSWICGLPFILLWGFVVAYIVRGGALAWGRRSITYRIPTPTGTTVVTLRGPVVMVIGAAQIIVGLLLALSLLGALVNLPDLNAAAGAAFCLSLPAYVLLARLLSRRAEVRSRHVMR